MKWGKGFKHWRASKLFYFKVGYCEAHIRCETLSKLKSHINKFVFVKYPKEIVRCYFYNITEDTVEHVEILEPKNATHSYRTIKHLKSRQLVVEAPHWTQTKHRSGGSVWTIKELRISCYRLGDQEIRDHFEHTTYIEFVINS